MSSVFNFSGIPVQIVNPALDEKTPFDDLPYLDRAAGCLIVFDLTDHASFTDLRYWWEVRLLSMSLLHVLIACRLRRSATYRRSCSATTSTSAPSSARWRQKSRSSGQTNLASSTLK